MKTIVSTVFILFFSVSVFAQEKCTFYTDKGTKEVKELKCGTFSDLMVKVPMPKNVADFNKVVVHYSNSSQQNEISRVDFEGEGALKMIAGKTKELWIHDPSNTEGKQGGAHGDFNLDINNAYISMDNLCTYPRRDKFESITITIRAKGYTVTGTEQFYSEKDKVWKTKNKYDKGTVLAEGTITIKQEAFENFYSDDILKIVFPDPSISFVKTEKLKTNEGMAPNNVYKVIPYTSTKLHLVEKGQKESQQRTTVVFNIVNELDIENLEDFKKAKSANASYAPVQYIKDAVENWFVYKSCGCSAIDDVKKAKFNGEICIGSLLTTGLVEELKKDKNVSNELLKKKETKDLWNLWSDKAFGKNTFGYGYIEKVFFANCNTGKLEYNPSVYESVEIFVYYKKPNIFIVSPYYVNGGKRGQFYDEQKQKEYVKKVIENVEFR